MKLSKLQKFILIQCWSIKKDMVLRREFLKFYDNYKKKPTHEDRYNIITKSLARLIKNELLVGFGEITREKVFVEKVRLTRSGRREARRLLDRQQKLPLKLVRSRKSKIKSKK